MPYTHRAVRFLIVIIAFTLLLSASGTYLLRQARAEEDGPTSPQMNPGDLDNTFDTDGKVTTDLAGNMDDSFAIAIQPDGKILLAGYATVGAGNTDFAIVRYLSNGSLDSSFGTGGKVIVGFNNFDQARAIAVMGDGRILAAGYSGNAASSSNDFALLRLTTNGVLDTTFDGDGKLLLNFNDNNDQATAVAVSAEGRITVAGTATRPGTAGDFALARLNPDGSLDSTFGSNGMVLLDFSNGSDGIASMQIQPDGKILVGGFASLAQFASGALVRVNANGSLDTSFDGDGKVTLAPPSQNNFSFVSIALQTDGQILALGSYGGLLLRYQANGRFDPTFGLNGKANISGSFTQANSVTNDSTGAIIVGGFNTINNFIITRNLPDGNLDRSFGNNGVVSTDFENGIDQSKALLMQSDGKLLLAGSTLKNGQQDFAIARYLSGPGCLYGLSPDTFGVPTGGGSFTVQVSTSGSCTWSTVNINSFISFAGSGSGTGNGAVTFTVAANTGPARIATLTVAGLTVTFRQDAFNTNPTGVGHLDFSFNYDGAVITNFAGRSSDSARALVVQPDSKFVLAGSAIGPDGDFAAVRYNPDGTLDQSFGFAGKTLTDFSGFIDVAYDMALQPDGKLLLCGQAGNNSSSTSTDFALARYLPDGMPDLAFGAGGKLTLAFESSSVANSLAVQQDSKILLAGTISNGISVVARFLPNGTLDTGFGNGGKIMLGTGLAFAVKLQQDGKVLIGGLGSIGFTIFRLLTDGSFDSGFGTGGQAQVRGNASFSNCALALQPDGKIVAGTGNTLLRFQPNGTLDGSFGFNGRAPVFSLTGITDIALQPDGKILATGDTSTSNFIVTRNHADGAIDTGFGNNGVAQADLGGQEFPQALLIQADGNVMLGGWTIQNTQTQADFALARIINGPTCSYAVTPTSRYLPASGGSSTFEVVAGAGCAWTAARNDNFLTITSGAGGSGSGTVTVTVAANLSSVSRTGTLTIAGRSGVITQPGNFNAPPNAPGNFDTSFDNDGKATADFFSNSSDFGYAITTQYDDRIIVAGYSTYSASTDFALARYNRDGTLDPNFGLGGKVLTDFDGNAEMAYAVAVQADGKIIAAGQVRKTFMNNETDFGAARYNSDGSLDNTFGLGGKVVVDFGAGFFTERLSSVLVQPDGKIVLAGYTSFGSSGDIALARLNFNGTLDATFGNGGKILADFNNQGEVINAALLQGDGRLLLAGATTLNGNGSFPLLVRYLPNGSLDTTFGTGGRAVIQISGFTGITGLAWLEDGKFLAAGGFSLARFLPDGTPDTSFGTSGVMPITPTTGAIIGVVLQSNGKIVTGNNFSGGQDFRVARFNANGTPDTAFGNNGVMVLTFYGSVSAGNENCRAVALLTNDDIVVAGSGGNLTPTGIDFALARLLGGSVGLTLSGRLTDNNNRPLREVAVNLSGAAARVATADANGNYSFSDLKAGGDYTVKTNSAAYLTTPPRRDFTNLTASQTGINFTADAAVLPPVITPLTDDFNGARDVNKWSIGALTRAGNSFDAATAVAQSNGQLTITPRSNVPEAHFNGYAAVNNFDFTNGAASVELMQAANGGGETGFAIGTGPEFYFRFAVLPFNANPSQPEGQAPAAESPLLVMQVRNSGQFKLLSVPYNPGSHRFLRLRHVPETIPAPPSNASPGGYVVFEASPAANPINYTELFRIAIGPRSVAQMSVELSAGTSNPINAPGQAIFDNFAATSNSSAQFMTSSVTASESAGQVALTVTRAGDTSGGASVEYATAGGTAQSGSRYIYTSGTLTFAPNETSKNFSVPLIDNVLVDGTQTVEVLLSNARGAALNSPARAILTITDNDTPGATNSIEDAQFFVRQQYFDFLNRVPDAAGLDYWTGQITTCGADAACIRSRRISVSAAFFVELEFQETGYVVYRFYRAAFGSMTPPDQTRANLVFNEFTRDRSQIIAGPMLEQSTREFAERFIQREQFTAAYPLTMTNAQFVNKLFDTANLTPFATERQAEIDALNNTGRSRAQVLFNVINLPAFRTREYNPSFVLMQYFGYLRRDPDQGGYDFWLNILNQQPQNFRGMVCAFLTSAEYQLRFGTQTPRSNQECGPGV